MGAGDLACAAISLPLLASPSACARYRACITLLSPEAHFERALDRLRKLKRFETELHYMVLLG